MLPVGDIHIESRIESRTYTVLKLVEVFSGAYVSDLTQLDE